MLSTYTNMQQAPVQTAMCSFGMSGKVFHGPFLHHHPGFNLYGVFERSSKNAHTEYLSVKSFSSYREMLDDETIELVIVNTPNATHFEYAKEALLAGKHVVVEKPFVTTVNEAFQLSEIAAANHKKLAVYQNRRFDSDFLTVKDVIEKKLIGEVVEAEFHFDRYKQELSPKAHKETPGAGTGIVYDLGSHIIDQALVLFGMPEAVWADISIMRKISAVDDYFEIVLFYPNKRVRLKGGYQVKHPIPSFVVHGTLGSFLKERGDVQETNLQAGLYKAQDDWGHEPETLKGLLDAMVDGNEVVERLPTLQGNYTRYFDQLYKSIREDEREPVTAKEGMNVIAIIEAAFKSSRQGIKVEL